MNEKIKARLEDCLAAASLIADWTHKFSFDQVKSDPLVESAFILQFERIGETLRIVRDHDPKFEENLANINQWVGLRHRLVHDYREIDLDLLWLSATEEVPVLIQQLQGILRK